MSSLTRLIPFTSSAINVWNVLCPKPRGVQKAILLALLSLTACCIIPGSCGSGELPSIKLNGSLLVYRTGLLPTGSKNKQQALRPYHLIPIHGTTTKVAIVLQSFLSSRSHSFDASTITSFDFKAHSHMKGFTSARGFTDRIALENI